MSSNESTGSSGPHAGVPSSTSLRLRVRLPSGQATVQAFLWTRGREYSLGVSMSVSLEVLNTILLPAYRRLAQANHWSLTVDIGGETIDPFRPIGPRVRRR